MTAFLYAFQNDPVKFVKQLSGVEQEYEAQKAIFPYIIEATSPSRLCSSSKAFFSTGCNACLHPHVTARRDLWALDVFLVCGSEQEDWQNPIVYWPDSWDWQSATVQALTQAFP